MHVNPGAMHAMLGLERQVRQAGFDVKLLDLVRMRASQINGCAYCLDMHSKDARAIGETPRHRPGGRSADRICRDLAPVREPQRFSAIRYG